MTDSPKKRERSRRLLAYRSGDSRRRWLRFSLRGLLITVTVLCVWIGMTTRQARRQKQAVEAIQEAGGQFTFDYQAKPSPSGPYGSRGGTTRNRPATPPGPAWLHRLVGEHFFVTPVSLLVDDQRVIDKDCLAHLRELKEIETLSFDDVELKDDDLFHLGSLKKLRHLILGDDCLPHRGDPLRFQFLRHCHQLTSLTAADGSFGNDDLAHLSGSSSLRRLFLYDTLVDNAGLVHLNPLRDLEMLGIGVTSISDDGLAHLSQLSNLSYLSMSWTKVTDKGLKHLKNLERLTVLELHGTQVTEAGAQQLQAELPNCNIQQDPSTVVRNGD